MVRAEYHDDADAPEPNRLVVVASAVSPMRPVARCHLPAVEGVEASSP